MVPAQGGYIYVCTKFEAAISFGLKVIRGAQNFEISSCDPGHTHFGVVLYSLRRTGPSSISITNLQHIAQFV